MSLHDEIPTGLRILETAAKRIKNCVSPSCNYASEYFKQGWQPPTALHGNVGPGIARFEYVSADLFSVFEICRNGLSMAADGVPQRVTF
jgi:hypothetical protein